jgi:hypothetical protein
LIFQLEENAVPCLPNLVGKTQSNISIHSLIHIIKSSGVPTHIKYLGLSSGRKSVVKERISSISHLVSPTDKPHIAIQS